ncbi:MAG: PTS IIA-like nitrogen regulatory protein PtsN [Gammaproteobacteria bacterium]|nr:PTS IIA-like nitrogen regulatory protein PtsN [Gammaproteobacteria bacterium]
MGSVQGAITGRLAGETGAQRIQPMKIADILSPDRVQLEVEASSKKRALEIVSSLIAQASESLSTRTVFDELIAREKKGNTGLGHGVALPHCRMPGGTETIAAFVRTRGDIGYDAADGEPVRLIFALLVPEEATDDHLQILASVAEFFNDEARRKALMTERSPEKAHALLCGT